MSKLAGIVHTEILPDQLKEDEKILQKMFSAMTANAPSSFSGRSMICSSAEKEAVFLYPAGKENTAKISSLPYLVLFDGYLLNKKELSSLLASNDPAGENCSNEELLAQLFRKFGVKTWEKLDGAFAAALYDRENRKLYLVRDRLGCKGLFFFCTASFTVFAGSLGALKKHDSFPQIPEERALWDYLSLQYIPQGTPYRNVRKLGAGSYAEISLAGGSFCVIRKYWKADFSVKENFSLAEAEERLRSLLFRSVEKHLKSMDKEAGKGIFLSGGVDSCIIGGICAKLGREKWKVFSMGFEESAYDERKQAEINFQYIQSCSAKEMEHFVSPVRGDSFPLLGSLAGNYGSPYADASLLPSALLCSFAVENGCSYAFCGDGADELFGGYERYLAMRYLAALDDLLPVFLRDKFSSLLLSFLPESSERGIPARAKRFLQAMQMCGKERYFTMISHVKEDDKQKIAGRLLKELSLAPTLENFDPACLLEHGTSKDKSEWCSEFDLANYLVNDCLVKMEIASDHAQLDARSPFLQNDVVDFAMKLPYSFKEKNGFRKRILCDTFSDLMPQDLARRKKRGFGVPVAAFLRKEWKEFAEETLLQGSLVKAGFFDPEGIKTILHEHDNRKKDHAYLLFSLIMAELSLREKFL